MEKCPQCHAPYGKRRRCYFCTGRKKVGQWITCERNGCGERRYVQQNQLKHEACRFCSTKCKRLAQMGQAIPWLPLNDLGHKRQRKDGYIEVKVESGYELEHRVMMAQVLGRPLSHLEEVHHKDLNRANNNIDNLELVCNGKHQHLHHTLYPQPSTKISVQCAWTGCDQVKWVVPSRLKTYKNVYCSNEHRLEAMHQKARDYHAENRAQRGYHPEWPSARYVPYGPNWGEQSRKCLERDGYRCQRCGRTAQLQVAHRVDRGTFAFEAYEQANVLENLITLCTPCHISFDFQQGIR
jgi:5-methylcytosine-specific restriction endonuclease McrA